MELETGNPICSLCRLDLSNSLFEGGVEAKLCNRCRDLVQTALHGNRVRASSPSVSLQQSQVLAYSHSGALPVGSLEGESSAFFNDLPALTDTSPLTKQTRFFNVNYGSFGLQFDDEQLDLSESTNHSGGLEFESEELQEAQREIAIVEPSPFAYETQLENEPAETVQPADLSLSETMVESAQHQNAFVEDAHANGSASAHPGFDLSQLHQSANVHHHVEQSLNTSPLAAPNAQDTAEQDDYPVEGSAETTEPASTDPWEQPLPAWDYSRNEYPVLMGPPKESLWSKYKLPAAVVLILVLVAGVFYLIYSQLYRDHATQSVSVPSQPTVDARAVTQKPGEPVSQSPAASNPAETPLSTDKKPPQQASQQEPVANQPSNAQGRFALQAAAFPTQAGADEFAEKLRAAGVPSYVVSADLAHRGKWFRVRVGRFNSAAEAQRFAGEAQLRAKAAGVSLQLVISQYD